MKLDEKRKTQLEEIKKANKIIAELKEIKEAKGYIVNYGEDIEVKAENKEEYCELIRKLLPLKIPFSCHPESFILFIWLNE